MEYTKPPLTFEQQAQKLIERGLIAPEDELIKRLCAVNYYRFSAYLYPFRKKRRVNNIEYYTMVNLSGRHYATIARYLQKRAICSLRKKGIEI